MRRLFFSFSNVLLVGFVVVAINPSSVSAFTYEDRQQAEITIRPDYSAEGVWKEIVPNYSRSYSLYIPEFNSYGSMGSTQYKNTGVLDQDRKPVLVQGAGEGVLQFTKGYTSDGKSHAFYLNYKMTPLFTGTKLVVYEFWTSTNEDFMYNNARLDITYPASWKPVSVWPGEASSTPGKLIIDTAGKSLFGRPVLVVFQTNSAVGTLEQVGKYTIAGSVEEVQKLKTALSKISFVDDLLASKIGITAPDKILIISDDLVKSDIVGYEADAVAGNPNVIVFNNRFTKNKSAEEVAEILAHEVLHLAVVKQGLFQGRTYSAPWFDEGLAVYFATLVHKQIFTDGTQRMIVEDLYRTHAISPQEATVLYEDAFDYAMTSATRDLGVGASYMHAGLMLGRFADKAGTEGFKQLFHNLKVMPGLQNDEEIVSNMTRISGLTREQLEFPGKSERDISGVVSRISRPQNDEAASETAVVQYIKGSIKHYFATGNASASTPTVTAPAVTTASAGVQGVTGSLTSNLGSGAKGEQVVLLQKFLQAKGHLVMPAGVAYGTFGPATKNAVKQYQKSANISATGYVGPATRAAINAALAQN